MVLAETYTAATFTHRAEMKQTLVAGEKVGGVRRIKRERVRGRVWDCCPKLVPGLNERRIRVKCSVLCGH